MHANSATRSQSGEEEKMGSSAVSQRRSRQREVSRRRFLTLGAVAGAGIVALPVVSAACGSAKKSATSASPTSTATGGTPSGTAQPRRGGTATVPTAGDPPHFDPQLTQAFYTQYVYTLVGSRLIAFSHGPNIKAEDNTLVPDVAAAMPEQPDKTTYVFKLRPGVKWQNLPPVSGRALTADDVKYTYERFIAKKNPSAYLLDMIDKVEVTAPDTVRFTLKFPYAPFLTNLAWQYSWIVAKEAVEQNGNLQRGPVVGTGPFMLKDYTKGSRYNYVRNPDYFVSGQPYLDGFVIAVIPDDSAEQSAFRSGQVDLYTTGLGPQPPKTLQSMQYATGVRDHPQMSLFQQGPQMRMDRPPFKDPRVRKAMRLLMNPQSFIETLGFGKGYWSGPVSPGMGQWSLSQDELKTLLKPDVQQAKQLLQEAGVANLSTTLTTTTGYGSVMLQAVQLYVEQARQAGVTLDVKTVDYATFIKTKSPAGGDYSMIYGTYTGFVDPDQQLYALYYSKSARNETHIDDPTLDAMIDKQRGEFDAQQRQKLVHDAQKYILANVNTILNPFDWDVHSFTQPWLENFWVANDYGWGAEHLWTTKG